MRPSSSRNWLSLPPYTSWKCSTNFSSTRSMSSLPSDTNRFLSSFAFLLIAFVSSSSDRNRLYRHVSKMRFATCTFTPLSTVYPNIHASSITWLCWLYVICSPWNSIAYSIFFRSGYSVMCLNMLSNNVVLVRRMILTASSTPSLVQTDLPSANASVQRSFSSMILQTADTRYGYPDVYCLISSATAPASMPV